MSLARHPLLSLNLDCQCGAHLYLLVRGKNHEEAEQRLSGKIKFYFNDALDEIYRSRIHIVNGDIASDRLGFYWPRLNKKHVEKMLSYCQEVGFI
jgi:thioester reductase-like protein